MLILMTYPNSANSANQSRLFQRMPSVFPLGLCSMSVGQVSHQPISSTSLSSTVSPPHTVRFLFSKTSMLSPGWRCWGIAHTTPSSHTMETMARRIYTFSDQALYVSCRGYRLSAIGSSLSESIQLRMCRGANNPSQSCSICRIGRDHLIPMSKASHWATACSTRLIPLCPSCSHTGY